MGSVRGISTPRELAKALRDIRSRIYKDLPGWHHPPEFLELSRFDLEAEPFWKTHIGQTFVHETGNEVVGRVTVFLPNTAGTDGRFGVFDSVDDPAVSGPLLEMACSWLASRGATRVEGPYFFNIHEEVGLMTGGAEHPSAVLMPYNPLYYAELLRQAGFQSIRRFVTFRYDLETSFEVVTRKSRAIGKYALRGFDMKNIKAEVARLIEVYNSAFSENWGFQPLTSDEGHALIGNLLQIGDPTLVRIAEHEGQVVGFVLCVPDVNAYMYSIRGYPGILKKAALAWAVMRGNIRDCRVITLAVRKEYQGRALSSLLIESLASEARSHGYRNAELSYVDTENRQMRRLMTAYDFHSRKEYQLFAKELGEGGGG